MTRIPTVALALALALAAGAVADDRDGQVRFLTGPQAGDPLDLAMTYLDGHRQELGLTAADLADLVVRDRYLTRHNGVTHIHLQQRLAGIEVWNGVLNVNVAADGAIISLGNGFVADLAGRVNTASPELDDRTAIERAAEHFGLDPAGLVALGAEGGPDLRAAYSGPRLSREEIPVRLVYQPLDDGVRLAWETVLNRVDNPDWWIVRVDATTGEVISKNNLTTYDSYLAIPYPPFDSPEDSGGQSVLTDPADVTASPFGWHDTDGAAGGEFTDTRGNNVNAQEDIDDNDMGGFRPDGGASRDFAFPFDPDLQPDGGTNLEAAIVNLFYANNVMHDLTYQYGFDEASGNFQSNNYGNGGVGGDQVEADAQDGSGLDNANFSTNSDGIPGRMQMYVWTNPFGQLVTVNPPSSIADSYVANPSNNGGTGNGLTGDLVLVDDGVAPATDACEALLNDLTGKIALIVWNEGACNSSVFVANAAAAGAVGAVIVDNNVLPTTNFGGSADIPSVAVGRLDGELFIATLGSETVNATLEDNPDETVHRDSDLDNGIIAHEYGHGISNRLTGGPSTASCLGGSEQAGEGWSDFWTLMLAAKQGQNWSLKRGVGTYVLFQGQTGDGIRNFPYSVDLGLNPQTYADIGDTNAPHGVGEIWMAMLWEVYWELVARHGFDDDLYNGTGGNNLLIQLVIDGMKFQPCFPDFVEARNAILQADVVNNGGAHQCEIWRGFAKRGLGVSADPGNPAGPPSAGDETEAFDIPEECSPRTHYMFADGFESGDTSAWTNTLP